MQNWIRKQILQRCHSVQLSQSWIQKLKGREIILHRNLRRDGSHDREVNLGK